MRQGQDSQDSGFALLEIVVALVIMAIVGLLAWRGMDAMIRGREIIDRRTNQDNEYAQLVRQFERDCQEILRPQEISILFSTGTTAASASDLAAVSALAIGAKNIWWLRRYRADNIDAWMMVGYGVTPAGLQRWTSAPLLRRSDARTLWASTSRDPDLNSSEMLVSMQMPNIVKQSFVVHTALTSGAGGSGTSASGTAAPSTSSSNTPSASPATTVMPAQQQGITMQWWPSNMSLPITRSCLMGDAL